GHPIITPVGCENLHQEVELGVIIGKTAKYTNSAKLSIVPVVPILPATYLENNRKNIKQIFPY
ncbi:hypothetical protein NECAME_18285, partial [Necator americanus]